MCMFFATSGAEAIAGIVPFACCVGCVAVGGGCAGGHATDVMVFPARRMARGAHRFRYAPARHAGCNSLPGEYGLPRAPDPFCSGKDA